MLTDWRVNKHSPFRPHDKQVQKNGNICGKVYLQVVNLVQLMIRTVREIVNACSSLSQFHVPSFLLALLAGGYKLISAQVWYHTSEPGIVCDL